MKNFNGTSNKAAEEKFEIYSTNLIESQGVFIMEDIKFEALNQIESSFAWNLACELPGG